MADVSSLVRISRINGNLQRGGWEVHFTSLSDTDILEVNQAITITWQGAFGVGTFGAARTAFEGHVIPQQFSFNRMGSLASFIARTTDGILKMGWLQGIGFADVDGAARAHYHQFDDNTGGGAFERMTMGRIVRHLLGYYDELGPPPGTCPDWVAHTNLVWHFAQNPHGWITLDNVTTLPFDTGVPRLDGSMRVDRYNVHESNNLWSKIQEIARNEFFVAYFDKEDNLWYCRHPMYSSGMPGAPAPVMTFDENFVIGKPVVLMRHAKQIRQVLLHAVTDDGDTLHAEYPASVVHTYGNVPEQTYIRCNDQDTLDEWARVKYLYENRQYTVRWTAPGLSGLLFEILDRVNLTYTGTTENGVHISWVDKKFWIHDISVTPSAGFTGKTVFTLEEESV